MEDQQMTRVAPNLLKRNTIGASIYGEFGFKINGKAENEIIMTLCLYM